ncbi:MAG TPA: polysaccharide deacetylase family protein [Solirubrobacteraceae bacterium]|jgi:peptidoglycan/xylan/chitin deacetylase (PgdA/CDA1 family)|nr:polysaccharide deacetylase family protein [Solirubrobacteraceae bacterium]
MTSVTKQVPIPILLYHAVADRTVPGHSAFTVTPSSFAEHLRAIIASGRVPLTVSALASALRGESQLPLRPVLLTFDDGFADLRPAVEAVLAAGLAASAFVTSGSIGLPGMVTVADVQAMYALGPRVEVGAHSVTHPHLDELDATAAAREIADSRTALEDILLAPVEAFAYPHGSYDRNVRTAVIESGFSSAVAVKNALSHSRDDVYALARITVTSETSTELVERLLRGTGARLAWRHERLRTRGYRTYRRLKPRREST